MGQVHSKDSGGLDFGGCFVMLIFCVLGFDLFLFVFVFAFLLVLLFYSLGLNVLITLFVYIARHFLCFRLEHAQDPADLVRSTDSGGLDLGGHVVCLFCRFRLDD